MDIQFVLNTMVQEQAGSTSIRRLRLDGRESDTRLFGRLLFWWHGQAMQLTAARCFDQWRSLSKCW